MRTCRFNSGKKKSEFLFVRLLLCLIKRFATALASFWPGLGTVDQHVAPNGWAPKFIYRVVILSIAALNMIGRPGSTAIQRTDSLHLGHSDSEGKRIKLLPSSVSSDFCPSKSLYSSLKPI